MITTIPNGLDEIIQVYGPLSEVPKKLITFELPYPLLYNNIPVHRATCHALAVDNFKAALKGIRDAGLASLVLHYGGLYANRVQRGGRIASTHAWGIAIDLELERYPLGSDARFPDAVIEIFHRAGFFYGGDFKHRPDPMHFQLATGY